MRTIVFTSNAYHFALPGFAHFWRKFWYAPDALVTIVGFDAPVPKLPANFEFVSLGVQTAYTWSSAMQAFLKRLTDDHFMLFLEDYYLSAPVVQATVERAITLIEQHPNIGKIDLTNDRLKVPYTPFVSAPGMLKTAGDSPFQMSLQAALWDTSFLLKYLDSNEDAWAFEKQGTRRLIAARHYQLEDRIILGCQKHPVQYVNVCRKGTPGYSWKYIPDWMQLELKHQVGV